MPVTGPEPLARNGSNAPVLSPALGVYVQLEPAVPGDEQRYEKACAIVRDWVGDKLRWTLTSTFGEPAPYDPEDFQYVVEHPASTKPPKPASTPELEAMQRRLQVLQAVEFSMNCHGGEHGV